MLFGHLSNKFMDVGKYPSSAIFRTLAFSVSSSIFRLILGFLAKSLWRMLLILLFSRSFWNSIKLVINFGFNELMASIFSGLKLRFSKSSISLLLFCLLIPILLFDWCLSSRVGRSSLGMKSWWFWRLRDFSSWNMSTCDENNIDRFALAKIPEKLFRLLTTIS